VCRMAKVTGADGAGDGAASTAEEISESKRVTTTNIVVVW